MSSLEIFEINHSQIRSKLLNRQIKKSYKTKGHDVITNNSLVYRKIIKLSSATNQEIVKFFYLFVGPYIVTKLDNNVATLISLDDYGT